MYLVVLFKLWESRVRLKLGWVRRCWQALVWELGMWGSPGSVLGPSDKSRK